MAVKSAGILLYKLENGVLRVLLVHPGGPFWAKKDAGAWSIPKGEYSEGEDPEAAARREFAEELGVALEGELQPLGEAIQPSRKRVVAYAAEATSTSQRSAAAASRSSGRRRAGASSRFPRSTGLAGSPWKMPARSSCPASASSSTGSPASPASLWRRPLEPAAIIMKEC